MVIYDFDPNNLPPEYLQAIGLVVAASSQTESVIQDLIGALLGIDNIETLSLTSSMSAPQRDRIARALAELNAPDAGFVDEIDNLLDAVDEAFTKRNAIVHNSFVIDPETKVILSHRLKAKNTLQLELRPIAVEEIQEHAALIYQTGMAIMEFMMSRRLGPKFRQGPLREPLDRSKKSRTSRHDKAAENKGVASEASP